MSEAVNQRDYTGVATAEIAAVYERYCDCDLRTFAARVGMDEGTLKQIVLNQKYPFQGLRTVDKIVIGLGQSLHDLTESGELTIIPARGSRNAARRMIEDSLVLQSTETLEEARLSFEEAVEQGYLLPPPEEEMEALMMEVLRLRGELARKSPEQEELLRRESDRASERLARKRREEQDAA